MKHRAGCHRNLSNNFYSEEKHCELAFWCFSETLVPKKLGLRRGFQGFPGKRLCLIELKIFEEGFSVFASRCLCVAYSAVACFRIKYRGKQTRKKSREYTVTL